MRTIVIGAGYWGVNYIKELGGNLLYVVETNKERANWVKETYNVSVYSEVFNDKFDNAIIVTPPSEHVKTALPILKIGKNVLIEKPLSDSLESCFALKKYERQIMVGHIYLYHPEIEKLKTQVQENKISHIFSRRTNAGPVRDYKNSLWDLAPHDVSIMNYFFDTRPTFLESMVDRDWAILRLSYYAIDVLIYVSWLGGPKIRKIELVDAENKQERIIFDDVKTILPVSPMRRMLDAFFNNEWGDRAGFRHGLEVVEVLEKVTQ